MPWNTISYDEMKKYIRFEFALRKRKVDENGDYVGYEHSKRYSVRECNHDDFHERGLHASNYDEYMCPEWEGEQDEIFLMNSNEASFNGGLEST